MELFPGYFAILLVFKIIVFTAMLAGMLVMPILPGLVIIWLAALVYGLVTGFSTLGWIIFAILTVLTLGGTVSDHVLMGTQAYKEGAAWWAIFIATLAALVGSFIIPIPIIGGVLLGLLTLFVIEWIRRKDWRKALASLKGMARGWGWAFAVRLIIGIVMIGLWLIWAWR